MPCSCRKKSNINKAASVFTPSRKSFVATIPARQYKKTLQLSDSISVAVAPAPSKL